MKGWFTVYALRFTENRCVPRLRHGIKAVYARIPEPL